MNLRGLGNLAKILEEAAKPDSVLREDREKPKPKVLKKGEKTGNIRVMDPKRKVWYEKRLKEITTKAAGTDVAASGPVFAVSACSRLVGLAGWPATFRRR